jgi:hypothetical protein
VVAAEEQKGNPALASHSLLVLDRSIPADRRWSVLHRGRPEMLDHILASQSLATRLRGIEAHNEGLADEAIGAAAIAGSSHSPLLAEFALD